MFDAIVCDPPYGHRAFQREIGQIDQQKIGRNERIKRREQKKKQSKDVLNQINDKNEIEKIDIEDADNLESNNNCSNSEEEEVICSDEGDDYNKNKENVKKEHTYKTITKDIEVIVDTKETKKQEISKDNYIIKIEKDSFILENISSENVKKPCFTPLKKVQNHQIFMSLITLADSCLKKDGILVFLYPTSKEDDVNLM